MCTMESATKGGVGSPSNPCASTGGKKEYTCYKTYASSTASKDSAGADKAAKPRGRKRLLRRRVGRVGRAMKGTSGGEKAAVEREPSSGSGWNTGGTIGSNVASSVIFMLARPSLTGTFRVWLR